MNKITKIVACILIVCVAIGAYARHAIGEKKKYADQFSLANGTVSIPPSVDGRFYPTLEINDIPIHFAFDQSARHVVLTQADARRVGIDTDALNYVPTPINWESDRRPRYGSLVAAHVTLTSVTLGTIQQSNFGALVDDGQLDISILGQPYITLLKPIEIADYRLLLSR